MARARIRPTRQDTVDRLIEGARRVFVERGFYGASIEDICAGAGLTRGAFYSAFGKKEDLFFALYDRMISDVSALFIAGLDRAAEHSDLDPIDALFGALADHFPIGRDWYVLNAEFTLFAMRDAEAAKALAARRQALRTVITDKLEVALALSHRQITIPPELFARTVIGLADAGLGQSLIEPDALHSTTLLRTFMAPLVRSLSIRDEGGPSPVSATYQPVFQSPARPRPALGGSALRQRLLVAAQTAFLRDGFGKTRMSDIATMAGISKKTIYAHAASKEALFSAVVREAIGQPLEVSGPRTSDTCDLAAELRAFLARYARHCFSDNAIAIYGMVVAEARQFPELLQDYFDAARNVACAELADVLKARAGEALATSPELAAGMLIEMTVAEPLRLAALGLALKPDKGEIERRIERAVAIFQQGATSGSKPGLDASQA